MVERWQKDADGILIFVSPQVRFCTNAWVDRPIDRFILCCRRCIPRRVISGPETRPARNLRFLPQEHLPCFR
jgi:hypothetical protein